MTVYIHIQPIDEQAQPVKLGNFHPWINSKDTHETVRIAVHKFLHDAGHLNCPEFSVDLDVCYYDDEVPCYSNGNPKYLHRATYNCNRP